MKKFRVDVFSGGNHSMHYFDEKETALEFAGTKAPDHDVFLLVKHDYDDKYDVIEEVK